MIEYLTIEDAMRVVDKFGFHIRDVGLLSSALARPRSSLFGTDAYSSLTEKAAAMLESLVRNHALIDGNKRTGWTLLVLFLWINGHAHDFTAESAFDLVVGVAEGRIELAEASRRIEAHRVPRPAVG